MKAAALLALLLALPAWAATPKSSKPTKNHVHRRVQKKTVHDVARSAGKKPACKTAKPAPAVAWTNEVARPGAADPNRERIVQLQEALEEILRGPVLGRLRVGMQVEDLWKRRVLFGWRSSALMDPASNEKVLATTAALLRLGGSFRYRTEVTGPAPDSDGHIAGDIVIRGSGDPSLRMRHIEALAQRMAASGVTRVTGAVLGDGRRIGSDEGPEGGRPPLRVGSTSIEIQIRPGDKVGRRPVVSLRPTSDALVVVNQAETRGRGRSRIGVSLERAGGRIRVVVTGKIAKRRGLVVLRRSPPSHPLFAAILLRQALIQAGIAVYGNAGVYSGNQRLHVARRPSLDGIALALGASSGDSSSPLLASESEPEAELLAVHESEPLSILLRRINKNSDNEWRVLREALADLGLSLADYLPANGSGLGHQNRVRASGMIALLRHLYFDPRVGPEIMQSLSVGGVDGTTRNRFRDSSAAHRVRAKTGTLRGVSCLSGFVGDGSEVLAFSILVEGHRRRAIGNVRAAQVSAVNAMMRFVRGAAEPMPGEEATPGSDYETGEETDERVDVTEKTEPERTTPAEPPRPEPRPPGTR
jgi:D-alanyl-D-alanine carboxypeptidase/D-alanyl-D-alanine-endopeptidase (penicillin-binding protein 4)